MKVCRVDFCLQPFRPACIVEVLVPFLENFPKSLVVDKLVVMNVRVEKVKLAESESKRKNS